MLRQQRLLQLVVANVGSFSGGIVTFYCEKLLTCFPDSDANFSLVFLQIGAVAYIFTVVSDILNLVSESLDCLVAVLKLFFQDLEL